jgi:hypothetical protein
MTQLKFSVYTILQGGLGNQLFQIANGYAYSLRHNKNFYVSRTWHGLKPERPSYWDSIFKCLQPYLKDPSEFKGTFYREPSWNYKEIPYIPGDVIFEGYFQCEKYFEDYSEAVRKLFNIYPEPKSSSDISVAIHIRRGDYLKFPNFHPVLQKEYYDETKKKIEEKIEVKPNYVYFSEDTEWVKETFKNDITEKDTIISGMSDIEEFQMMVNCDHFIIANSTFGWWASWFANSKLIIAPKVWFGPDFVKDHGSWNSIYRDIFKII